LKEELDILKDLIYEKHRKAEETLLFKSLVKRRLSEKVWANFLFNKMFIMDSIEAKLDNEFSDLFRSSLIKKDLLNSEVKEFKIKDTTRRYINYIETLNYDKLFAHVYVWYMGDLSGGQIIKKVLETKSSHLDFKDPEGLKSKIMSKVSVDMIEEVNVSFDWVTELLNEFEQDIIEETD
jgi:heme oxygenase